MTATFRTGRRLACVAVLAALPLSACAAGYQAETSRERTTLTSVTGAKGDLTLDNVFFVGPAGSGASLPLYIAAFNGGTSDDTLLRISSSVATSGVVPSEATIPAGGSLAYKAGEGTVPQLTGLKDRVLVGQTVTVTLSFAKAGDLQMKVPVESSTLPGPSAEPSANATTSAVPSTSSSP